MSKHYETTETSGVKKLVKDYYYLKSRREYKGDYGACDILIDLDIAIDIAGLGKRQREALEYAKLRYTLEEIGEAMGIAHQTVDEHLKTGFDKIAEIFKVWESIEKEENYV